MLKLLVSVLFAIENDEFRLIGSRQEKSDRRCKLLVNDHDHTPLYLPGMSLSFSAEH
jgi:hypothetical protein